MLLPANALLARISVPRTGSTRDITALETAMQGLTLDGHHPIALEIAGTATSRVWVLRATTPTALQHLVAQMQARYPQAEIDALEDDPLVLHSGEIASVEELRPGAASYLPLRTLSERELLKEGADPLLGLLAAFDNLPPQTRAIAQLVLLPLPAPWSRTYRRRAVEHPLEQERFRRQMSLRQSNMVTPSPARFVGLLLLVILLLLWWRFQKVFLTHTPAWLLRAGGQLIHGRMPQLTPGEMTQLLAAGVVLLMLVFSLAFLFVLLRNRFGQAAIYDMRLVDEKTGRLACRVRLRLIVISPLDSPVGTSDNLRRSFRQRIHQLHLWLLLPPGELRRRVRAALQKRRQMRQAERTCKGKHQGHLDRLAAAYRQYHAASGAYFLTRRLTQRKIRRLFTLARKPGWAADVARSTHLLSVADVATLWHLPQSQDLADLNYVSHGRARTFLVPAELTTGRGYKLGESRHAGQTAPVFLPHDCLHHNLLAVASTGKGKSTLFHHLACATMQEPERGVIVIEPHGDLVARLLGNIPANRQDEVVIIDLASKTFPAGINPLDMSLGRDRDKAVDNLIQIAEAQWATSYGPRTENVLEYSCKTLADANVCLIQADPQQGPVRQYTLLDIVPLLSRPSFRHAVLEQVSDAALIDWWKSYYEPKDLRMQGEITSSVMTKISKFASSRVARRILGQPQTTVNFQEIIRQGKILLISTASGVVGADTSSLIGALLLGLIQATLAEQASDPIEQRRSVLMLIDEFQTFGGVNYQSMLAELRKYGGAFGLATQSLAYLDRFDRTLRATVLANIDHLFAFTMAAEDAHLLRLDAVEETDITQLDDYQCYARLSVNGRRLPLFSLNLDLPPVSDETLAHTLRLNSRQRDAHPAGMVDAMLRDARARQQHAAPTRPVFSEEESEIERTGAAKTGAESGGTAGRRKKKRGNGGKAPVQEASGMTQQIHLMYEEDGKEDGDGKVHQPAGE